MQINKKYVAETNLKGLLFHLLSRWRSILIVALIGAIALGGYQYFSVKRIHDMGKQTKDERQYQIDLQQYKEDLVSNRNTIDVYSKLIQEQNDYLNGSTYIKLSPQNVWVASKKYLVKVDQSVIDTLPQGSSIDPTDSILPAYTAPLSEITDEEELKSAFGLDNTEYIDELVFSISNLNDNTVTIYVLGETKETALSGLALLDKQMEIIATGKANEIARHQLMPVSESVVRGIGKELAEKIDLADKQKEIGKTTEENQEILQKARQTLDKLEADGEPKAPRQRLVMMVIIGFLLGGIILAFLYAVLYILGDHLNSSHDFSERYRIPVFGELSTFGHFRTSKGIDKLFARWGTGKNALNDETVYNSIAKLIAEKQEAGKILLVSTLPADKLIAVKEALSERLSEKNIKMQGDAVRNSESIAEAVKADAVIITEAKEVSSLKDMDRMAENLIISEANVIGAIIL